MPTYSKMLLIPCMLVVFSSLLGRAFEENDFLLYGGLTIDSFLAITIGYRVILLDRRETLKRCAMPAAMIGVIRFLVGLPFMILFQWDSARTFAMAMGGYFLSFGILISWCSLLGLLGGKLRLLQQAIKKEQRN
jgi:hypothetical protein